MQPEALPSIKNLWRISNHIDLSGEGGRISSARWHTEGQRIVYLAESPAGAIVERLVHLLDMSGDGILPRTYRMLRISMGEGSKVQSLEPPSGMDWKTREEVTRKIGDAWLTSRKAALARVPSVIAPYTWNYLLNPEHPDAKHVRIAEIIPERFDGRLFRLGGR